MKSDTDRLTKLCKNGPCTQPGRPSFSRDCPARYNFRRCQYHKIEKFIVQLRGSFSAISGRAQGLLPVQSMVGEGEGLQKKIDDKLRTIQVKLRDIDLNFPIRGHGQQIGVVPLPSTEQPTVVFSAVHFNSR